MNWSYEQFRAALSAPNQRAALGLDLSDAEAQRIAGDEALGRAYFSNWQRANAGDGTTANFPRVIYPAVVPQTGQPALVQAEVPAKKRIGCFGVFMIIISIVIAIVIITNIAAQSGDDGSADTDVVPQKSAAQKQDETAVAEGWQVGVSGDIYLKAAEAGSFTCGTYDCLWYTVTSVHGCSGGVYVKADIMSNGVAVGWTNVISASVAPRESVAIQIEDHQGIGDAFRIAETNCMG